MHFLITLEEAREELSFSINNLILKTLNRNNINKQDFEGFGVSERECSELLIAEINDCIFNQLVWLEPISRSINVIDTFMDRFSSLLPEETIEDLKETIYYSILSLFNKRIIKYLEETLELSNVENRWLNYDVNVDGDTIVIVKGKDYRVTEYERLVEQGVIKPPKTFLDIEGKEKNGNVSSTLSDTDLKYASYRNDIRRMINPNYKEDRTNTNNNSYIYDHYASLNVVNMNSVTVDDIFKEIDEKHEARKCKGLSLL